MNCLTIEVDDSTSSLLELAANNDVQAFRQYIDRDPFAADEVGLWYGRMKGSNRMVLEQRTPLMVAATYGSVDVLKLIISLPSVDVNRACGPDGTTALHCAASGGSLEAVGAVKMLLAAGADPNLVDANGNRPADVVIVPPKLPQVKNALEQLLGESTNVSTGAEQHHLPIRVTTCSSNSNSPPLSLSPDEDRSPSSDSTASPPLTKFPDLPPVAVSEKKEYPVDPSLPDIKNSIYATDEFRMFSFKIRPCSRAYSHDWTECPFVHPGENARRRDPRKYHYSCVPCPDFRKGTCRRGDMCEYAHGVFECWLHPAQYRTRLCKDGTSCSRRVCFFAHTNEELRPLYMSTGSAVPSPRSSSSTAMEMAAALGLMPGSPSSVSAVMAPFTPPMSPSANGVGHSSFGWPQPNVPTLNLPGSNVQSSRLRSTLSARDIPVDDLSVLADFDSPQLLNDVCYPRLSTSAGNRSIRTKTLTPSNLDELFSAELASPRYNSDQGAIFSPSHRSALFNQLQQQQSVLSPINTNVFSPKSCDAQHLPAHSSLLQASLNGSSPCIMSPRSVEPVSPMSSRLAFLSQRDRHQHTLRCLSSRDFAPISTPTIGSPVSSSWSKWASLSGAPDWGVNGEELGRLKRSSSFEMRGNTDEPDLSWVQSLVRESPPKKAVSAASASAGPSGLSGTADNSNSSGQMDGLEQAAVLGAWLEQMQLDQVVT